VDSPLAEEAQKIVYRLQNLSGLWVVIQGRTSLPPVVLPNLISIDIEYEDDLDWLEGFRGAVLDNLEVVSFHCESEQIGDFIGAFKSVMLTTSVQDTLLMFGFYTSRVWNPNYSSLLSFGQLKELDTEFSCEDGCSSRVDNGVITNIARAMPRLEILKLGKTPCETHGGVTVQGLITLSTHCLRLSELRVHFQGDTLFNMAKNAETIALASAEPVPPREDCALTDLEVGEIVIPPRSTMKITLLLLQIFPRIIHVRYENREWKSIAVNIRNFRRIGILVRRTGKAPHRT